MGTAAAVVIVRAINVAENPDNVSSTVVYRQAKQVFLVKIGDFEFNWFMLLVVLAIIASHVVLYKTKFGLRLCACGEHPQAADSVGISVYKMRYAGVLISGALGGLGGLVYITAGVSEWKFENGVAGFGFLALAVMIFGQWRPVNIGLAARKWLCLSQGSIPICFIAKSKFLVNFQKVKNKIFFQASQHFIHIACST